MNKRKTWRTILIGLGVLIFLLTLFQMVMDGVDGVMWVSGVLVPILLISVGLMGSGRGGYITANCWLEMRPNMIIIEYPAIDRCDNRGIHKESLRVERNAIRVIQYSEVLHSFRIIGAWTGRWSSQGRGEGIIQGHSEMILYPPEERMTEMYDAFQNILGIAVVQMDEM